MKQATLMGEEIEPKTKQPSNEELIRIQLRILTHRLNEQTAIMSGLQEQVSNIERILIKMNTEEVLYIRNNDK